jgi:hypothetical protein
MVVSTQGMTSAIGQVMPTILKDQHQERVLAWSRLSTTRRMRERRERGRIRRPGKSPSSTKPSRALGGPARVAIP